MRKQIHMIKRNGVYYFRRRIPQDLLSHYSPKLEIIFSLKTSDHTEADRLQRSESVKLDDEFERIRKGHKAPEINTLSPDIIKSLADLWAAHILEEDEELRIEGLSEGDYNNLSESLDIVGTGGKFAFARRDTSLIEFEMEDFCESQGFKIAKGSDAHKQLCYAFLRASVQANQQLETRHPPNPIQPIHVVLKSLHSRNDFRFLSLGASKIYYKIPSAHIVASPTENTPAAPFG